MNSPSLYDFAPLAQLLLLGLAIAAAPLAWVWWRTRQGVSGPRRLRALALLTLFLTFDLVLFGAFTRLTDSGLGCPDWPGCYGSASPIGAKAAIAAAQQALPTGPVTFSKAWIEMIHRYLASAVGALILILAVLSWRQRRVLPMPAFLPLLTLGWVCLQGAFGAWTVTMKLFPAVVTLHLLAGLGLLALLRVQSMGYVAEEEWPKRSAITPPKALSKGLRWALGLVYVALWVQIALGGWVSTNYAVLACTDFPTCQGSWWPEMNFAQGFTLWRELGQDHTGQTLVFSALTAIHYVHRLGAYVVLGALAWLAWRLWSVPSLKATARWLAFWGLWQLSTGLANVVFDWPLLAAVSHTGGAAALVLVLTAALWRTFYPGCTHPRPPLSAPDLTAH